MKELVKAAVAAMLTKQLDKIKELDPAMKKMIMDAVMDYIDAKFK